MTTVALRPVRRWIRERQDEHDDGGGLLGNVYFAALLGATVIGICWPMVKSVFWPAAPSGAALTAVSVPLICAAVLHLFLRRFGPLAVSRPAASWLLTAPVSRRALLSPSARIVAGAAAAAGAVTGFAVVSQVVARPADVGALVLATVGAALLGVLVALSTTVAQRQTGWARTTDLLAYVAVVLGMAGLIADRNAAPGTGLPADGTTIGYAVSALAVAVVVLGAVAHRRLDRTHPQTILAAATATGTVADATALGQPSFVTDLAERRYWAGRRWRASPLSGRLPVLTAADLRVLRRRPTRLVWAAAGTLLPAYFVEPTGWLPAAVVLLGAMYAASSSVSGVRTDAANPAMLRLLGISARQAVLDRAWVPIALASVWAALALVVVTVLDGMPPGPWWALGLALGPAAAAGAIRRSRLGLVQNGLLPLDTPMGSLETGPLLAASTGFDLLLVFGAPTLVLIGVGQPLTWSGVLTQLIFSIAGLAMYVGASTSTIDADLRKDR